VKTRNSWVLAVLAIVLTVFGFWFLDRSSMDMTAMTETVSLDSDPRRPLYWVAPMDANYRRNEPGLSPMGMPLIPVYESSDTITVSPSIQQNLGLRTAVVLLENFSPSIQAVGYTAWDQSTIQILHTRAEGWLEVFNLASEGDAVVSGDVLYELFSPNLVSAQREYLSAFTSNNAPLISVARDRLLALGFSSEQVAELNETMRISNRLAVHASKDAVVTKIDVREGSYVTPSTTLVTMASLDSVWVEAEMFESLLSWVKPGQTAEITFPAYPGETWHSKVGYIYPDLNAITRSLRVRLVVENSDGRLLPDMFARVSIAGVPKNAVLTVPREAVIRSGNGDRVIISIGDGQFRPVVVRTGIASGTRLEIISGLEQGDIVVSSGQFLLDSEANGEQAFARLAAMEGESTGVHADMSMETDMGAMADSVTRNEQTASQSNSTAQPLDNPLFETSGEIISITAGATVTISHRAVLALSWPAMVMGFALPSDIDVEELSAGDSVDFAFQQSEQGGYQIVRILKQGASL